MIRGDDGYQLPFRKAALNGGGIFQPFSWSARQLSN
jgi:hypothetical protein